MSEVPKDARERLLAWSREPGRGEVWLVPSWVISLALSALDAQEAAGEGVTEEMVKIAAAEEEDKP